MNKNNKYTLHIYNSTQKIKVDGKCSIMFVDKSLEPHLIQKIEILKENIVKYDEAVVKTLGTKSKKKSVLKSRSGAILVSCNRCEFTTKSQSQHLKHKRINHITVSPSLTEKRTLVLFILQVKIV